MNSEQLHWVAGLLEGEGCFQITKTSPKKDGSEVYSHLSVTVNIGDEDIVRRLKEYIGYGNIQGPYLPKKSHWTPMWRFAVQKDSDARKLMQDVLPLMGKRRSAKIKELLDS